MSRRSFALAVVGHTNAGKTSLLRTLTRRRDFGEVSDRPGTTRHVESVRLALDDLATLEFSDTPGLEDPVGLLERMNATPVGLAPTDGVRAFLKRPEAREAFEQEAKVLRTLLACDAAFYVIDTREAVLPKHHCEVELLNRCGVPLMPVLNFVRDPRCREADWRRMLAEHGLHVQVAFDAVAPRIGAELALYRDLSTLLGARRETLDRVVEHLRNEGHARRAAGLRSVADSLVGMAALRQTLRRDEWADEALRQRRVAGFRGQVAVRAQRAAADLLATHGFAPDDAETAGLPGLAGRWEDELFNPAALQAAAVRLGAGAAVGAAIGLGLDAALAGLSLGAGMALGAAVGGVASQGWSATGHALFNRLSGRQDLTLDDSVLLVLAARLLQLWRALAEHGHAATHRLAPATTDDVFDAAQAAALLKALAPARAHPRWAEPGDGAPNPAREATVDTVQAGLVERPRAGTVPPR